MRIAAAIFFWLVFAYVLARFVGAFIRAGRSAPVEDDHHRHFGLRRKTLEDIAREVGP